MKKTPVLAIASIAVVVAVVLIDRYSLADKPLPNISEKAVLAALMKNSDVLLKDGAHCEGVAIDASDRTIGDYLSGFWSFHASRQGSNWIEVSSATSDSHQYLAKVMIYRKDGEENWGWGVSFVLDRNKIVLKDSFTCLGSG